MTQTVTLSISFYGHHLIVPPLRSVHIFFFLIPSYKLISKSFLLLKILTLCTHTHIVWMNKNTIFLLNAHMGQFFFLLLAAIIPISVDFMTDFYVSWSVFECSVKMFLLLWLLICIVYGTVKDWFLATFRFYDVTMAIYR